MNRERPDPHRQQPLLEGLIVQRPTCDPPHAACLSRAARVLESVIGADRHVRIRSGITTCDSEPEPDLVIVRGHPLDYSASHPGPEDVALLAEISSRALVENRTWKRTIYARGGVPLHWVINLEEDRVEVYSDPSGPDSSPAYRRRQDFRRGENVPLAIAENSGSIPVADLLLPRSSL